MFLIGKGRTARETYPSAPGGSAVNALRNRNVSAPESLTVPFTPATSPSVSIIAALLYTPRVSGVILATALLDITNGATGDTYGLSLAVFSGTGLSVTGGAVTSNGWVLGSTVPPVVGGAGVALEGLLGSSTDTLGANAQGTLAVAAAISQPLPVGVPVVIEAIIDSLAGHPLAAIAFTSLSILELP